MPSYNELLKWGFEGEETVIKYLLDNYASVIPLSMRNNQIPYMFNKDTQTISPDLLVTQRGKTFLIDVKRKSRFAWYGREKLFTTGIDIHNWEHYKKVSKMMRIPCYIFFLHELSDTSIDEVKRYDAPVQCPTGLFKVSITTPYNHMSGSSEMVYWGVSQ